jgi:prepilin-type N-terminal cleavage/methylation domain-containing protein
MTAENGDMCTNRDMSCPLPSRGFTLIELLIVVSVLGVLAGLTLLVTTKVKASAEVSKCSANLTQWSQAIKAYSADWNGRLPGSYLLKGQNLGLGGYFSIGSRSGVAYEVAWMRSPVSKCPAIEKYYIHTPGNAISSPVIGNLTVNRIELFNMNMMYSANANLYVDAGGSLLSWKDKITSMAQVRVPAKAGLLTCGAANWNTAQGFTPPASGGSPQGIHHSKYRPGERASGTARYPLLNDGWGNFLSFDGSIRLLKPKSALANYDDDKFYLHLDSATVSGMSGADAPAVKSKWENFWNVVGGAASAGW